MTEHIAADDVAGATVAPDAIGMDGVTTQAANGTAHPEDAAAPAAATEVSQPENPLLTKLQESWAEVQDNSCADNFSTWANLVSTAEKLDDLQQLRKAYDAFLERYPLCYGYWKKYAEAEKRHAADSAAADPAAAAAAGGGGPSSSSSSSTEAAAAVYQRGVAAVPHSAELWVAYAALLQGSDAPSDAVRSVYEAAAAAVGSDYTSGLLWDKYLAYEATQGVPSAVAALYARVLKCPVKDLDKYHTGLTNYASSRTAAELLPEDTTAAIKAQLEQQAAAAAEAKAAADAEAKAAAEAAAAAAAAQQQGEDAVMQADSAAAADGAAAEAAAAGTEAAAAAEGAESGGPTEGAADVEMAEAPPADAAAAAAAATAAADPPAATAAVVESTATAATADDEQPAAAAAAAAAAAEPAAVQPAAIDDAAIKAAWLAQQEASYQATKQQLAAISGFEGPIRRPYWHHKPLDAAQLQNWVAYLDWQQQQQQQQQLGDVEATRRLFERCLVPCANYPEFWIRYVLWCEAQGDANSSSSSSTLAAEVVLSRAVGTFCRNHPGLAIFAARFYEGCGDAAAARAQYQQLVTKLAPGLIEAVVAYANFEHRTGGPSAAQAVYEQALASSKEQQQQQQQHEEEGKAGGAAKSGSSSSSRGFLHVMYANFLRQVVGDIGAARGVLQSGLALHPDCKELWEGALWFEETLPGADRVERVLALYDQLLKPKAAAVAKQQQQQQDGSTSSGQPAAPAAVAAAQEDGSNAAPEAAVNDSKDPAAAAAAEAGVLPDDVLESLSERCVEFADMYADLKTLQGVQRRHLQLFPLPAAAIAARQRDSAAGGSATAATAAAAAAAAANGYAKPDAAAVAAGAAAAAAADHAAYGAAAAAGGYYPPPPGGYYPPSHYPPHGGYGPPHHYGPPPHHYGHHYGYGGYGGY